MNIIEADRLVDILINSSFIFNCESVDYLEIRKDCKTLFLTLPRRSGKTTYIEKLYSYLKLDYSPLVISNYITDYKEYYKNLMPYSDKYRGRRLLYDALLFDEVNKGIADKCIGHMRYLGAKPKLIIGMYTP